MNHIPRQRGMFFLSEKKSIKTDDWFLLNSATERKNTLLEF